MRARYGFVESLEVSTLPTPWLVHQHPRLCPTKIAAKNCYLRRDPRGS